jgi:hypothetical protein
MKKLFVATNGETGENLETILTGIIPEYMTRSVTVAGIVAFWTGKELVDRQAEFPGKKLIVYREFDLGEARTELPPGAERVYGIDQLMALCSGKKLLTV